MRTRRLVPGVLIGLLAALGPAAVPAGAAVFAGSQSDPSGDSVIVPGFGGASARSMDLTGASVSYDSVAGALTVTFSGTSFVHTHSGTAYRGSIHSTVTAQQCGPPAIEDLTFTGSSGTSSGGGPGHGTATLEGAILDGGSVPGVVSFPVDFPAVNQVVQLTFTNPSLAGRAYRCATDLQATFTDSQNIQNIDGIVPFCIVAGCLDPPVGSPAVVAGGPPAGGAPSGGVTAQAARISARCSILPRKIRTTTARMLLMQRVAHRGSASHRRAVTRQARVLAARRTSLRATLRALCG